MMDDDELNMRNWGYYEPSFKGHLGLQLMSTMADCDSKHYLPRCDVFFSSSHGGFPSRDSIIPEAPVHTNSQRYSWINHGEKFPNSINGFLLQNPIAHPLQSLPTQALQEHMVGRDVEQPPSKRGSRKRPPKLVKAKKAKKPKENSPIVQHIKPAKKSVELVINGINLDLSDIPVPVCSCTGKPHQCYRWGYGGWQSACCTTNMSMHPLPMNTNRLGSRIAGRKMSQGTFKKVLEKLASEGYNFVNSIDLRTHWARHGSNKFATIR